MEPESLPPAAPEKEEPSIEVPVPAASVSAGFAHRLVHQIKEKPLVQQGLSLYDQYEHYTPAVFFLAGVGWDSATLTRIDKLFDNFFLLLYLLLLGALITVALLVERERLHQPWLLKYKGWFPGGVQFFLGALLSAYTVYYAQSASFTETSLFLLFLIGLLIANEFMHQRLVNLYLLYALYFVACFSFFLFFLPILTGAMGYGIFFGAGMISLLLVGGLLTLLFYQQVFDTQRQFVHALALMGGVFVVFNLFYVLNWIPPVPLAMREGGIYHQVERMDTEEGAVYALRYEKKPWYNFWSHSDSNFLYAPGDSVYTFAAIFAPGDFEATIYYEWFFYHEGEREWVRTDRMASTITGGRDGGWRDFKRKTNIPEAGAWKVEILTEHGKTLGRIAFDVTFIEPPPERRWETKTYR